MNRATRAGLCVVPMLLFLSLVPQAVGSVYTDLVLDDDPIGYWRLNESGSGSGTVAEDFTTYDRDLTYYGGVSLGASGIPGAAGDPAAGFNGSTSYLRDSVWGQFVNSEATLSLWFNPSVTAGTQYLIGSMGVSGTCCWRYKAFTTGDKARFQLYHGDADGYGSIISDDSFQANQWNHLAITYEVGGKANMWLNGVKQTGQLNISDAIPWGYLEIGTRLWDGPSAESFTGTIDEVAVYDKALTSARIKTQYVTGLAGALPPRADVAVYHLDEGTGSTAHDATIPSQHGTVTGATWTTGEWGDALSFDGTNDYVETTLTEAVSLPLSVEAWVKTTDDSGGIVNKYVSGSYNGFQVFMVNGHLGAWYLSTSAHTTRTDGSTDPDLLIGDGEWHHTVTVFDDTGTTHYVDGVLAYHANWSGGPADSNETTPLRLGTYPNSAGVPNVFFSGLLDEVALYGRALTADEVYARFLAGPPDAVVPEPSAFLLAALGLLGLALPARRRRRNAGGPPIAAP